MKKSLALLLTALIIISCTACAPDTDDIEGTAVHTHSHTQEVTNDTSARENTDSQASAQEFTQTQTDASQPEQATQTEAENPQQSTENNLYRGTISGNTYKSSTTGLTFTKPTGWTFLSDEELAGKIGADVKELADNVFPATADRVPAVYDMWATDPDTGINISVAYENMYVTASVAMTTDEYMEMLEGAFKNTEGTSLLEKATVKLSGQTYLKAVFKTETGGTSTQSTYYLRGMGKFMNIVLVTAPTGTQTPDIEKMFS